MGLFKFGQTIALWFFANWVHVVTNEPLIKKQVILASSSGWWSTCDVRVRLNISREFMTGPIGCHLLSTTISSFRLKILFLEYDLFPTSIYGSLRLRCSSMETL
jgi:hypothetical protein